MEGVVADNPTKHDLTATAGGQDGRLRAPADGLRVLTIIPDGGDSGFVFSRRQVESLRQLGVDVDTFFLANRQSLPTLVSEWKRFRQSIHRFKPQVVHVHYGTITALFCAVSTRLPMVVTYHGSDLNPVPSIPRWRSFLGHVMSQIAAGNASRIVCVSEGLRKRLWWRQARAAIIPMGVDLSLFSPRATEAARRELGWSPADRVVLFNAGNDAKIKRLDLAEQALAVASRLVGPIRFVVTDGTTPPDAMPVLMNAADCLLVTSDHEGSPTVVKEALACNLPVVSVDVGDVRDQLRGVEPSWIVDRDPERLGRAVAEVFASGRRSNGRTAAQQFDSRTTALRVAGELEAALARRRSARTASAGAPSDVTVLSREDRAARGA